MATETDGLSDQFQALRLFVQIARTGSFSKGARAMALSQPTASRIVALLEEQLGTTLFSRSTRALTLTDAGTTYLGRVQSILDSLEEADNAVRGEQDLRGTLRIAMSSIVASRTIVPRLGSFLARYPNLHLNLTIDDRRQDLIQDGIDIAIRFGKLPDSSAIARLIGRWPLVVAAAPAYLDAHGTPETPEALTEHTFVIAGPVAGKELSFHRGEETVRVQPKGQVSIDSAEVAVSAVRAGLGVAVASLPSFKEDLDAGQLVRLLPDWSLSDIEAHALFANGQTAKRPSQPPAPSSISSLKNSGLRSQRPRRLDRQRLMADVAQKEHGAPRAVIPMPGMPGATTVSSMVRSAAAVGATPARKSAKPRTLTVMGRSPLSPLRQEPGRLRGPADAR